MPDRLPGIGARLGLPFGRRAVLKASAAALSVLAYPVRTSGGQDLGTVAGEWVEADQVGVSGDLAVAERGVEPITFRADFPFSALAPHWSGEAEPGAVVELSVSPDGETWTDPILVGEAAEDGGRPERGNQRFGRLLSTPGAAFVRYRTLDAYGNPTVLPGLAFTYFDATAGPGVDDVYSGALAPFLGPPPIIPRAAWGADEGYRFDETGEIWPPEYQPVAHIIVHHTDTVSFQDPVVAIRSIYYYHAVVRGWGDIGYNYLVDFMGHIYEGRFGG